MNLNQEKKVSALIFAVKIVQLNIQSEPQKPIKLVNNKFTMSLGLLFCILYWIVNKGDISGLLTMKAFLAMGVFSMIEYELKRWKK